MLAIIGGSGLRQLPSLKIIRREIVRTPYGEPSSPIVFGEIDQHEVVFLARHGHGHTIPPHAVNYRANIWAESKVGVTEVLGIGSVGAIAAGYRLGDLVLPNQVIDYTYSREATFFDGRDKRVFHIEFTEPYSAAMRSRVQQALLACRAIWHDGGVYGCSQGPRLETAAEINRMERDGCTVVGMTGMPEAVLAKEAQLSYVSLCAVSNYAAGRGDVSQSLLVTIDASLAKAIAQLLPAIEALVRMEGKTL